MDIKEVFILSFDALKERKVRSILTILMVMAGSSLLVAVNGFGAGFEVFFNNQFNNLAPNILFISSVQQEQNGPPVGGGSNTWSTKNYIKCCSHREIKFTSIYKPGNSFLSSRYHLRVSG